MNNGISCTTSLLVFIEGKLVLTWKLDKYLIKMKQNTFIELIQEIHETIKVDFKR